MTNFKFLVVLAYYNRPEMFRNGLKSLLKSNYSNWHLAAIDDGSDDDKKAEPILEELFGEKLSHKYTLYDTEDTLEMKLKRGSIHSSFMNKAIRESDADYVITIGDDDGVHHEYFWRLNEYYNKFPETVYSFCHVIPYDPVDEKPDLKTLEKRLSEQAAKEDRSWHTDSFMTINHYGDVPPVFRVDCTQVSWHRQKVLDAGIEYDESLTVNCDAKIFGSLFERFGLCKFNRTVGPYKAFHADQLGMRARHRKEDLYNIKDT
jgi:glycosyltransferase involved in cell wall biosynthesis